MGLSKAFKPNQLNLPFTALASFLAALHSTGIRPAHLLSNAPVSLGRGPSRAWLRGYIDWAFVLYPKLPRFEC